MNNNNNNEEEEDDFEEEIELQQKTANSIKENTRNEKGEQQVAVAAVSLRQKKGGQKRSNELDSIRFSMYNIQSMTPTTKKLIYSHIILLSFSSITFIFTRLFKLDNEIEYVLL